MVIWISQKRGSHGARIKFSVDNTCYSMTIEDNPRLIGKKRLPANIANTVKSWILLNKETLLDYWNLKITTTEVIKTLRKIN